MFDTGPQPTRATPAGCLVGLLALASFIFSGIGIWGLEHTWQESPRGPCHHTHFDRDFWVAVWNHSSLARLENGTLSAYERSRWPEETHGQIL